MLHILSSNDTELLEQAAATITAADAVVVLADIVIVDQHSGIIDRIASCVADLYYLPARSAPLATESAPKIKNQRTIDDAIFLSLCEQHSPIQTWY